MNNIYQIHINNNGCNFEIRINGIRIHKHANDYPVVFELPMNQYIKQGKNEISIKMLPLYGTSYLHKEAYLKISATEGILINDQSVEERVICAINSEAYEASVNNNIDLPFFEFAGAFEVREWGPNKLFTDLEPVKIDMEVIIGFYQELYQDIKHNRIKELLSKMNFKIQLYASSYFQSYDEELKRTEMFLSQLIEKKLQPFEFKHYKPEFIMKDFLISYEDEDGDQNIFFTDSIDDAYTFYPFIIGKIKNKQGLSVIL